MREFQQILFLIFISVAQVAAAADAPSNRFAVESHLLHANEAIVLLKSPVIVSEDRISKQKMQTAF
jgi:hypothetical protein